MGDGFWYKVNLYHNATDSIFWRRIFFSSQLCKGYMYTVQCWAGKHIEHKTIKRQLISCVLRKSKPECWISNKQKRESLWGWQMQRISLELCTEYQIGIKWVLKLADKWRLDKAGIYSEYFIASSSTSRWCATRRANRRSGFWFVSWPASFTLLVLTPRLIS